jgi:hypothetical protein
MFPRSTVKCLHGAWYPRPQISNRHSSFVKIFICVRCPHCLWPVQRIQASFCKQLVSSKPHRTFSPLNREKCLGPAETIDLVLLKRSPAIKDGWKLYSKVLLPLFVLMGHLLHQQMKIINNEENKGLFISYIKIFKLKFTDDNEVCFTSSSLE